MKILHEADVNTTALAGRKIAVLGFGSQGRAQALNLHDGGHPVVVGARPAGPSAVAAAQAGLPVKSITDAVAASDVILMLLPDEVQGRVYTEKVHDALRPGSYLGFAHGFAIHYQRIIPDPRTNIFLVGPNGIGPMVRSQFTQGRGVPGLVAIHQDSTGDTRDIALAYACAIGCGRAGIIETTFREETETDLFAEQAVLCGGLTHLIQAGFDTLVEAGYAPEIAYFCCLHEIKLIADLIQERGVAGMRRSISNTALYGDLTRGPRVVSDATRAAMRDVLAEIRSGNFAKEWDDEVTQGLPRLNTPGACGERDQLEQVGNRLRKLMPWLPADGQ